MTFLHDTRNTLYREPFGAVCVNTSVRLRVGACENKTHMLLLYELGDIKEESTLTGYYSDGMYEYIFTPEKVGVYFYTFVCGSFCSEKYQITVYECDLSVPSWFCNSVIYQIFPDRFRGEGHGDVPWNSLPAYIKDGSGNVVHWDFFGGTLKGIESKLGYIRDLGANVIYLNPIFKARSNHRYDTGDYTCVDSRLGSIDDFNSMIASGKDNDIRFILDGVFSHTGRDSIYFNNERCRDWYTFNEDGSYDCWWGSKDLPEVDEENPSYVRYIISDDNSVLNIWGRRGIYGWRLDVADELPDSFIMKLRDKVSEINKDAIVLGEVWEDASNKVSYGNMRGYFTQRELHSVTNYVFRETVLDFFAGSSSAEHLTEKFLSMQENYPKHNFNALVNMTGSHDVKRLMSCMLDISRGNYLLAYGLVKAYSLLQFCMPGVPLIYYGDEICLEGGIDPDNRRTFPWEDTFLSGRIDYNFDMADWFREITYMRKRYDILRNGEFSLSFADENVFVLKRTRGSSGFILIVDRFGRGSEYMLQKVEIGIDKRYSIYKQADGYALLLKY